MPSLTLIHRITAVKAPSWSKQRNSRVPGTDLIRLDLRGNSLVAVPIDKPGPAEPWLEGNTTQPAAV